MPKKLTMKDMHKRAHAKEGKFLSTEYKGIKIKYKWECKDGHIFFARADQVASHWCPDCWNKNRSDKLTTTTMDEIQNFVSKKWNGECLSTQYHPRKKLKWKCKNGCVWYRRWDAVKSGSWCSNCKIRKKLRPKFTIEDMQKMAAENNGKCLSEKYINARTHLEWECKKGHRFKSTPDNIKQGHWCRYCRGHGKTIKTMQELAKEKFNGVCLSKEYINDNTKLRWQCEFKHKPWDASPSNIIRGTKCPTCSGRPKITIDDVKKEAKKQNIKCLSRIYKNAKTNLKFECPKGHTFNKSWDNFKNKKGRCPICIQYKCEKLCRITFEQLFEKPFPKCRPKWLINKRGNRMELDGYNKELGIAFEYNGEQHLEINHFSPTQAVLDQRVIDDQEKVYLCDQHNIKLLVITFRFNLDELPQIIEIGLSRLGVDTSKIDFTKKIDTTELIEEKYQYHLDL